MIFKTEDTQRALLLQEAQLSENFSKNDLHRPASLTEEEFQDFWDRFGEDVQSQYELINEQGYLSYHDMENGENRHVFLLPEIRYSLYSEDANILSRLEDIYDYSDRLEPLIEIFAKQEEVIAAIEEEREINSQQHVDPSVILSDRDFFIEEYATWFPKYMESSYAKKALELSQNFEGLFDTLFQDFLMRSENGESGDDIVSTFLMELNRRLEEFAPHVVKVWHEGFQVHQYILKGMETLSPNYTIIEEMSLDAALEEIREYEVDDSLEYRLALMSQNAFTKIQTSSEDAYEIVLQTAIEKRQALENFPRFLGLTLQNNRSALDNLETLLEYTEFENRLSDQFLDRGVPRYLKNLLETLDVEEAFSIREAYLQGESEILEALEDYETFFQTESLPELTFQFDLENMHERMMSFLDSSFVADEFDLTMNSFPETLTFPTYFDDLKERSVFQDSDFSDVVFDLLGEDEAWNELFLQKFYDEYFEDHSELFLDFYFSGHFEEGVAGIHYPNLEQEARGGRSSALGFVEVSYFDHQQDDLDYDVIFEWIEQNGMIDLDEFLISIFSDLTENDDSELTTYIQTMLDRFEDVYGVASIDLSSLAESVHEYFQDKTDIFSDTATEEIVRHREMLKVIFLIQDLLTGQQSFESYKEAYAQLSSSSSVINMGIEELRAQDQAAFDAFDEAIKAFAYQLRFHYDQNQAGTLVVEWDAGDILPTQMDLMDTFDIFNNENGAFDEFTQNFMDVLETEKNQAFQNGQSLLEYRQQSQEFWDTELQVFRDFFDNTPLPVLRLDTQVESFEERAMEVVEGTFDNSFYDQFSEVEADLWTTVEYFDLIVEDYDFNEDFFIEVWGVGGPNLWGVQWDNEAWRGAFVEQFFDYFPSLNDEFFSFVFSGDHDDLIEAQLDTYPGMPPGVSLNSFESYVRSGFGFYQDALVDMFQGFSQGVPDWDFSLFFSWMEDNQGETPLNFMRRLLENDEDDAFSSDFRDSLDRHYNFGYYDLEWLAGAFYQFINGRDIFSETASEELVEYRHLLENYFLMVDQAEQLLVLDTYLENIQALPVDATYFSENVTLLQEQAVEFVTSMKSILARQLHETERHIHQFAREDIAEEWTFSEEVSQDVYDVSQQLLDVQSARERIDVLYDQMVVEVETPLELNLDLEGGRAPLRPGVNPYFFASWNGFDLSQLEAYVEDIRLAYAVSEDLLTDGDLRRYYDLLLEIEENVGGDYGGRFDDLLSSSFLLDVGDIFDNMASSDYFAYDNSSLDFNDALFISAHTKEEAIEDLEESLANRRREPYRGQTMWYILFSTELEREEWEYQGDDIQIYASVLNQGEKDGVNWETLLNNYSSAITTEERHEAEAQLIYYYDVITIRSYLELSLIEDINFSLMDADQIGDVVDEETASRIPASEHIWALYDEVSFSEEQEDALMTSLEQMRSFSLEEDLDVFYDNLGQNWTRLFDFWGYTETRLHDMDDLFNQVDSYYGDWLNGIEGYEEEGLLNRHLEYDFLIADHIEQSHIYEHRYDYEVKRRELLTNNDLSIETTAFLLGDDLSEDKGILEQFEERYRLSTERAIVAIDQTYKKNLFKKTVTLKSGLSYNDFGQILSQKEVSFNNINDEVTVLQTFDILYNDFGQRREEKSVEETFFRQVQDVTYEDFSFLMAIDGRSEEEVDLSSQERIFWDDLTMQEQTSLLDNGVLIKNGITLEKRENRVDIEDLSLSERSLLEHEGRLNLSLEDEDILLTIKDVLLDFTPQEGQYVYKRDIVYDIYGREQAYTVIEKKAGEPQVKKQRVTDIVYNDLGQIFSRDTVSHTVGEDVLVHQKLYDDDLQKSVSFQESWFAVQRYFIFEDDLFDYVVATDIEKENFLNHVQQGGTVVSLEQDRWGYVLWDIDQEIYKQTDTDLEAITLYDQEGQVRTGLVETLSGMWGTLWESSIYEQNQRISPQDIYVRREDGSLATLDNEWWRVAKTREWGYREERVSERIDVISHIERQATYYNVFGQEESWLESVVSQPYLYDDEGARQVQRNAEGDILYQRYEDTIFDSQRSFFQTPAIGEPLQSRDGKSLFYEVQGEKEPIIYGVTPLEDMTSVFMYQGDFAGLKGKYDDDLFYDVSGALFLRDRDGDVVYDEYGHPALLAPADQEETLYYDDDGQIALRREQTVLGIDIFQPVLHHEGDVVYDEYGHKEPLYIEADYTVDIEFFDRVQYNMWGERERYVQFKDRRSHSGEIVDSTFVERLETSYDHLGQEVAFSEVSGSRLVPDKTTFIQQYGTYYEEGRIQSFSQEIVHSHTPEIIQKRTRQKTEYDSLGRVQATSEYIEDESVLRSHYTFDALQLSKRDIETLLEGNRGIFYEGHYIERDSLSDDVYVQLQNFYRAVYNNDIENNEDLISVVGIPNDFFPVETNELLTREGVLQKNPGQYFTFQEEDPLAYSWDNVSELTEEERALLTTLYEKTYRVSDFQSLQREAFALGERLWIDGVLIEFSSKQEDIDDLNVYNVQEMIFEASSFYQARLINKTDIEYDVLNREIGYREIMQENQSPQLIQEKVWTAESFDDEGRVRGFNEYSRRFGVDQGQALSTWDYKERRDMTYDLGRLYSYRDTDRSHERPHLVAEMTREETVYDHFSQVLSYKENGISSKGEEIISHMKDMKYNEYGQNVSFSRFEKNGGRISKTERTGIAYNAYGQLLRYEEYRQSHLGTVYMEKHDIDYNGLGQEISQVERSIDENGTKTISYIRDRSYDSLGRMYKELKDEVVNGEVRDNAVWFAIAPQAVSKIYDTSDSDQFDFLENVSLGDQGRSLTELLGDRENSLNMGDFYDEVAFDLSAFNRNGDVLTSFSSYFNAYGRIEHILEQVFYDDIYRIGSVTRNYQFDKKTQDLLEMKDVSYRVQGEEIFSGEEGYRQLFTEDFSSRPLLVRDENDQVFSLVERYGDLRFLTEEGGVLPGLFVENTDEGLRVMRYAFDYEDGRNLGRALHTVTDITRYEGENVALFT